MGLQTYLRAIILHLVPFFENVVMKEPDSLLVASFMPKHHLSTAAHPETPPCTLLATVQAVPGAAQQPGLEPAAWQCSPRTALHMKMWNATVNIVRPQPFQFGTQGVSHRLLHSACVWGVCQRNGRRQMIPLLCETAATHCSDSPGVTQQHLHQLQNTSPLSVPVSAGYLFLPPDPPQVNNNRAVCFSTGGWYRAGGSAFLLSICLGLWGVQNHSSITAAFSLCPKWLSPFLWGRLSLLVEICCLYQEQVHLHYRKALKEHNWALISICL